MSEIEWYWDIGIPQKLGLPFCSFKLKILIILLEHRIVCTKKFKTFHIITYVVEIEKIREKYNFILGNTIQKCTIFI